MSICKMLHPCLCVLKILSDECQNEVTALQFVFHRLHFGCTRLEWHQPWGWVVVQSFERAYFGQGVH
jgi:hypothetical protein